MDDADSDDAKSILTTLDADFYKFRISDAIMKPAEEEESEEDSNKKAKKNKTKTTKSKKNKKSNAKPALPDLEVISQ